MTDGQSERVQREKEAYNKGLRRGGYNSLFSHTHYYYSLRRCEILRTTFSNASEETFLELGAYAWFSWLERNAIIPKSLTCINISEAEIEKGRQKAAQSENIPEFRLMDAHSLEFPPCTFDLVFGDAILHHLQMPKVLDEIERVLKPGGKAVFEEPLATNPVGAAIRALTPFARTIDEQPLRRRELKELQARFHCEFHFEQFLSVPAGIISRLIARSPENGLMRAAYRVDERLKQAFPALGLLYRSVLIVGSKPTRPTL